MSTKLIGFEIKKGTFTNEKTGELVPYSNRALRFVTDDGADNKVNFGFSCYEEPKVKMSVIASALGISETDEAVDMALRNMLNKEVIVLRMPKNNELVCVGVRLANFQE